MTRKGFQRAATETVADARVVVRIEAVITEWPVGGGQLGTEVEVYLNDEWVGGGNGPGIYLTDIAADTLYGDTNDMLNDYHGALGEWEREWKRQRGAQAKPSTAPEDGGAGRP